MSNHTIHPQGTAYQYDQLNRLVRMDAWQNLDLVNSEWQSGSPLTDYHTEYTYDANGNLTTLLRNGASSINTDMDDLTYHYISGTNRLDHVDDAVTAGNYPNDIDDQSAGNYDYDAIGNLIRDNAEGIANIEWTVYGKVKRVTRSSINFGPDLEFTYGPSGQRIMKKAIYDHPGVLNDSTLTTLYVRDAGGNIMTVYREVENATVGNEFYIMEQDLYGSSRLGTREKVVDLNVPIVPDPDIEGVIYVERGYKKYELSNHLGNVMMTVSDRRTSVCVGTTAFYYGPDIISVSDYYPFGVSMPGRTWNTNESVNGFNGKRKDDEWQGSGNAYDFGARIYDPRLGRWMAIDPQAGKDLSWSPYNYAMDNPNYFIDPNGRWPIPSLLIGYTFKTPSSPFGQRGKEYHAGNDYTVPGGTQIRAAAEGRVIEAGWNKNGYGYQIIIDHGNGYYTRYAHLQKGGILVAKGDYISDGDIIGLTGNTGNVRGRNGGYHLHFEIHKSDKGPILSKETSIDPSLFDDLQVTLHGDPLPFYAEPNDNFTNEEMESWEGLVAKKRDIEKQVEKYEEKYRETNDQLQCDLAGFYEMQIEEVNELLIDMKKEANRRKSPDISIGEIKIIEVIPDE